MIRILTGDCREVLKTLPDESVHCVVTSPPYWGLRDYGVEGQLGLETTPDEYVANMVAVLREVRRVLRSDGTLWLNLGDSYAGGGNYRGMTSESTLTSKQRSNRGARGLSQALGAAGKDFGLAAKQLVGIPWRVAFALQADGWWLRQDIIWAKPNPMPESVRDRCTKSHEYLFLLSKSSTYYYDADAIAEPVTLSTVERMSQPTLDEQAGSDRVPGKTKGPMKAVLKSSGDVAGSVPWEGSTRNKRSVWTVTTQPFSEAHFATFPPALIEPCVLAGCPERTCGACGTAIDSRYGKVRTGTKGKDVAPVRVVRGSGVSGPEEPGAELLQQGVCVPLDGEEPQHDERPIHDIEGLHSDLSAAAPGRLEGRIHDGAPAGDGEDHRQAATSHRGRASSGRQSRKQQAAQSRNADEAGTRQPAEAQDRDDSLSPLRGEDPDFSVCPSCGAALDEVGVQPGVVLDCFGGAGTTGLVADRHHRDAILIELNPSYSDMAQRRISGDAPLFAQVCA